MFGMPALPAFSDSNFSGDDQAEPTPAANSSPNSTADAQKSRKKKDNSPAPDSALDQKIFEEESDQSNGYPKVVIGPGDELSIEVYDENIEATYQVDSDGIIEFPYAGRVNLAGLTPVEASEKLDILMDKPRSVTVLIMKSNTFWISVLGDVRIPGKIEIRGKNTLASVLAEVGGPMPDANLDKALLVHGRKKTFVPMRKLLRDEGDTGDPLYIYPGDTLMVYRGDWPATIGDVTSVIGLILSGVTLYFVARDLSK